MHNLKLNKQAQKNKPLKQYVALGGNGALHGYNVIAYCNAYSKKQALAMLTLQLMQSASKPHINQKFNKLLLVNWLKNNCPITSNKQVINNY